MTPIEFERRRDQRRKQRRLFDLPARFCTCGGESQVIDVIDTARHSRRRRECKSCGARWTTREYRDDAE